MYMGSAPLAEANGELAFTSTGTLSLETFAFRSLSTDSSDTEDLLVCFPFGAQVRGSSLPSIARFRWLDVGWTVTLAPGLVWTRISMVWSICVTLIPSPTLIAFRIAPAG